jgi:hypothetical protein
MGKYDNFWDDSQGIAASTPAKGAATRATVSKALATTQNALLRSPEIAKSGKYDKFWDEAQDIASGKPKEQGGILGSIGGAIAGVGKLGLDALAVPEQIVASGLKELSDVSKGDASVKDFFKQATTKGYRMSTWNSANTGSKWLDTALNLGQDILTDPLMWTGFGAAGLAAKGGRTGLAVLAGETNAARVAKGLPELFAAKDINQLGRLGQYAKLSKEQQAALNIQRGLRYQFGAQNLVFKPETVAGKVSAETAKIIGGGVSRGRAMLGDVILNNRVANMVTPKSMRVLGNLGRKGSDVNNVLQRVAAHSSGTYERTAQQLFYELEAGKGKVLADELLNSPYRGTVYQVMDGTRAATDPAEQALADALGMYRDSTHATANDVVREFNMRRGANASTINKIDNYGVPRSLTDEAGRWVNSPEGAASKSASQIAGLTGLTKQEFVGGPTITRMRTLGVRDDAGNLIQDTFLGKQLVDGSIDDVNRISEEVLGFKWFETDAAKLMQDYTQSASKFAGRVAFVDRMLDFGPQVIDRLLYKIIPTDGIEDVRKAILAQGAARQGISDALDVLEAKGLSILDGTLANAERELAAGTRRSADIISARRSIQRKIVTVDKAIARAEARAAGTTGAIRESYEVILGPLRDRANALRAAMSSEQQIIEASIDVLAPIHMKLLPNTPVPTTVDEIVANIRNFNETRIANVAKDVAEGKVPKTVLSGAKGQQTKVENVIAKTVDDAIDAVDNLKLPSGEKYDYGEAINGLVKTNKEIADLEKNLADEISAEVSKFAEKPIQKRTELVTALDNNTVLKLEQTQWEKTVRPQLEASIDELKQLRYANKVARGADAKQAEVSLETILRKGYGVGGSTTPIPNGVEQATEYAARMGRVYQDIPETTLVNPDLQKRLADAYAALPDGPPAVGSESYIAYEAFRAEIKQQYKYLTEELGIKVEIMPSGVDPYRDAAEMVQDVLVNKRLKIYSDYSDHPMLRIDPETGIHENHMLRAVHDYFGHIAGGSRFDRNGEELAFLRHMQMFSDDAGKAATVELRGQNAYLIRNGDFPPQKAHIMDASFSEPNPIMSDFVAKATAGEGASVDVTGRELFPDKGFVVSRGGKFEAGINQSELTYGSDLVDKLIAPFISNRAVADELLLPNRWLGTWYDEASGTYWVGVSEIYPTEKAAYDAMIKNKQIAAYDIASGADLEASVIIADKVAAGKRLTPIEKEYSDAIKQKIVTASERTSGGASATGAELGGRVTGDNIATQGAVGQATNGFQGKSQGDLADELANLGQGRKPLISDVRSSRNANLENLAGRIRVSQGMTAEWLDRTDKLFAQINDPNILDDAQRQAWDKVVVSNQANEKALAQVEGKLGLNTQINKLLSPPSGSFYYDELPSSFYGNIVKDVKDGWVAIENLGVQMPKELSDLLFSRIDTLGTKVGQNKFFQFFRQWNQFFRVTAMLSPGFIVRNAYTGAFNNFVAGGTIEDTVQAIRFATVLQRRGLDAALDSIPEMARADVELAYRGVIASGGGQTLDIIQPMVDSAKTNRMMNTRLVKAWSTSNENLEIGLRMSMALRGVKNGLDLDQVGAMVTRYHFNYQDLSKLDEYAKLFVPFWTFASKNIGLQFANQFARPSMYLGYEKLKDSMPVDENLILPEWLARREPLGLTSGVVLNPDLPQVDMADQLRNFSDPLRLLGQAYPQYRLIPELAGNRMFNTGIPFSQKLQPVRGPADYPSALLGMLTGQTVDTAEGKALTSKGAYVLPQAIPLLGTLQRLLPQLGGQAKYTERQGSSIAGFLGAPVRGVSAEEQERALTGREISLQRLIDELQRRGYVGQ